MQFTNGSKLTGFWGVPLHPTFFKFTPSPQQKFLDMPLLTILWYSIASVQCPLSYTITKLNWCIQYTGKSSWWSTAPCWSLETKQKGEYCQTTTTKQKTNQANKITSKQNHIIMWLCNDISQTSHKVSSWHDHFGFIAN